MGAGPAGSACAQRLARAGLDTLLVDSQPFPRDKVCGDGLIPDAHHALRRLGVHDEVMSHAERSGHVAMIAPRGGRLDVPGTLAVLPRRVLDDIVKRAAERAGARFRAPARFESPLVEEGRVVGARLQWHGRTHEVRARWTVLATGAAAGPLVAAGVCTRRVPSGIALRGYVHNPSLVGRLTALEVVWHRALSPGYGWIFPAPDGRFNIGVGLSRSHSSLREDGAHAMKDINLRHVFDAFCRHYPPAAQVMKGGTLEGDLKGAPLRCTLEGAQWSRPGLLVAGEAAGSTYSFTGEGIGKALETGMLAADALQAGGDDATVRGAYEASLQALKPRFDLYEKANAINAHPWLADLVIWRARHSGRLRARVAGVLEETSNPGHLLSLRGVAKVLFPSLMG